MNNINIEYISDKELKINGELWNKVAPVKEEQEPYFPKPKCGESYYFINNMGEIECVDYRNDGYDLYLYDTLNCWLDEEELDAYIARYGNRLPGKLQLAIRRWKIAKGVEDVLDWENANEYRYYIEYSYKGKRWCVGCTTYYRNPTIEYFRTPITAHKCLDDLQEYFQNQLNEWNEGK